MTDQNHNPQREQMAHESMLRCLRAQAEAIWPQERPLFERYGLPAGAAILDLGCGPGEMSERLLDMFPTSRVTGVDILPQHVAAAATRCARFGARATFRTGDAFALDLPARTFDLALCRHMTQAVPEPEKVVAQLVRVTKRGGVVHLLAEDYAMMHFSPTTRDCDEFFRIGPGRFAQAGGTDLRSGRRMPAALRAAGCRDVRVDYVIVDTERVPRETFAAIWISWRDGYTDAIAAASGLPVPEVRAYWDEMIAAIRNQQGYAVWFVPIVSARVA